MSAQHKRSPAAERRMMIRRHARREEQERMKSGELAAKIHNERQAQREEDADRVIDLLAAFIDAKSNMTLSPVSAQRLRDAREALKAELLS